MFSRFSKYTYILLTATLFYVAEYIPSPSSAYAADNSHRKTITKSSQEIRPFDNMVSKMILLADEVLTAPAIESNAPAPSEQPALLSEPVPETPELPDLDNINNNTDPNLASTPNKDKQVDGDKGLIGSFFDSPKITGSKTDSITPKVEYTEPRESPAILHDPRVKRYFAEKKAREKRALEEQQMNDNPPLTNSSEPSPVQRPLSYKTQLLPNAISKKTYSRDNQHLPQAVYNEEYKEILFSSAASGNLDILRAMIAEFGDTEVRDLDGNTPLIYAAMAGTFQSVISLTSLEANINAQNYSGVSALSAATKLGRLDIAQFLLSRHADPELGDKTDKTPLMIASEMDFSRIAELLLDSSAEQNTKMKNGNTAIHLAVKNNSLATLNLLITNGAEIDIRNFKGYTPLMLAIENNLEKSVALLLTAGADITKTNALGMDVLAIAVKSKNTPIINLVEGEQIRRKFLALDLIETRKSKFAKPQYDLSKEYVSASRTNGIPLPVIKKRNFTKARAPRPFFSKEELAEMQKP